MSDSERAETNEEAVPDSIAFEYIKSNTFRVIHADGAVGGLTPQGKIHFALYSERGAIPQRVVHRIARVDGDLKLLGEIPEERQSRDAVIREVEVDVVMDTGTALALVAWLMNTLKLAPEPNK